MSALLTFLFWYFIFVIFARSLFLITSEYPRQSKTTLGGEVFSLIVVIAMLVWVCFIKFGVHLNVV